MGAVAHQHKGRTCQQTPQKFCRCDMLEHCPLQQTPSYHAYGSASRAWGTSTVLVPHIACIGDLSCLCMAKV